MIFFLSRSPDNETYGIASLVHKIKLGNGDNVISYSFNEENIEVPFAPKARNKNFVEEVKKHVKH